MEVHVADEVYTENMLKKLYHKCLMLGDQIMNVGPAAKGIINESAEVSKRLCESSDALQKFFDSLEHVADCLEQGDRDMQNAAGNIVKVKHQLGWLKNQLELTSKLVKVKITDNLANELKENTAYVRHMLGMCDWQYRSYFRKRNPIRQKVTDVRSVVRKWNKRAYMERGRVKKGRCTLSVLEKRQLVDNALYFREALVHLRRFQIRQAALIAERLQEVTERVPVMASDVVMQLSLNDEDLASSVGVLATTDNSRNENVSSQTMKTADHLPVHSIMYDDSEQQGDYAGEQSNEAIQSEATSHTNSGGVHAHSDTLPRDAIKVDKTELEALSETLRCLEISRANSCDISIISGERSSVFVEADEEKPTGKSSDKVEQSTSAPQISKVAALVRLFESLK
uniref:Uncharacterized protein n=1 Tax=Trichuris muris TaxID=70415 RepID=A0A5S6QQJ0_TRIMR